MSISFLHPALDKIADFSAGVLQGSARTRIANHLADCVACQNNLRLMQQLRHSEQRDLVDPPNALLAKILESRRLGTLVALPAPLATELPRKSKKIAASTISFAAIALLFVTVMIWKPRGIDASESESALKFSSKHPRPGDVIHVQYSPSVRSSFREQQELNLRGRLRSRNNQPYSNITGVPVFTVATLAKSRNGTFDGEFVWPDSVVFGTFAVEDGDAKTIDSHDAVPWELIVIGKDGKPTFDALLQRYNDMFGRSWEEAYNTARQLVKAYPKRATSWASFDFVESQLNRNVSVDSTARRVRQVIVNAKTESQLDPADIELIHYRTWTKTFAGASAADSAEATYWWKRLLSENPSSPEVAQRIAYVLAGAHASDPRFILDSLERTYPRFAARARPVGTLYYNTAISAAKKLGNDSAFHVWLARMYRGARDSSQTVAIALASDPTTRKIGINALQKELARKDTDIRRPRGLTETASMYQRLGTERRAQLFMILGQAQIAERASSDAVQSFEQGSALGWNAELLSELAKTYAGQKNYQAAAKAYAGVVVDPRLDNKVRDSLTAYARTLVGDESWTDAVNAARESMTASVMRAATSVIIEGAPMIRDSSGIVKELRDVARGKISVVMFWSPECGAALQASAMIEKVASALEKDSIPLFIVVEGSSSANAWTVARANGLKQPLYFDMDGSLQHAFSNFGTPQYYVVGADGRIKFRYDGGKIENVQLQTAALRSAAQQE